MRYYLYIIFIVSVFARFYNRLHENVFRTFVRIRSCVFSAPGVYLRQMPFLRLFCLGGGDMQDPRSHTCCFSGYRPEKMPFRTYDPDAVQALEAALDRAVEHAVSQGYHTFLSGMAAGFDIWAAEAVIRARAHHDIRLLCAVPHDHQSDRFPPSWKKRYNVCLVNSDAVRVFASNYFSGCFSVRNRFMVDSSSLLICYFDGQAGGTAQTVHYAQGSGLRIINLSPRAYDQLSLL
ncbi:DUF1273 family protein [Butyricicoccus sp. AM42-5AC]|nr:DUF1273 family protein [Butyricicoccus sp. AM42-5AC]